MKKCPFCAEDIQDDAVKCRYCGEAVIADGGEFLLKPEKEKWYFRTPILVLLFLSVGPLALPLLWLKPGTSKKVKVIVTVLVLVLTYYSVVATVEAIKTIIAYYREMSIF